MKRSGSKRGRRLRRFGGVVAVLTLGLPAGVGGQLSLRGDTVTAAEPVVRFDPDLRLGRELTLAGFGIALEASAFLISVESQAVPVSGLDPLDISWHADLDVVGNRNTGANNASNWTRNLSLVFPFVLAAASGEGGERWESFGRRSVVYAETLLITHGLTQVGKEALGRARPYAYIAIGERPDEAAYDVAGSRTFHSMPSGHSSSAWTGAAIGMTEHLLGRPDAKWFERVGTGFAGGALAGTTSALRVAAGQHFPSDVLAGAALGIATGVTVPLLHRGQRPLPSTSASLQTMAGALAGTLLGVLIARGY